jgi:SAM-dependent methyltransferase
MQASIEQDVRAHYTTGRLAEAGFAAVAAAGLDADDLRPDQLAPMDEFHMRGRAATRELAESMGLTKRMRVLDAGSGLGGAARHLATAVGCRVVGVDLVPEYVEFAQMLTERCGLGGQVSFRQGSALELPFAEGSFDAVMTQHASMNIADKPALYTELRRVLRPGGRLGIYDILEGPSGDPQFPVPWARDSSTSFLATPSEMRLMLIDAGFGPLTWRDTTRDCLAWFETVRARAAGGSPPLGLHVMLGTDFPEMVRNMVKNLADGRIAPVETVWRRA